MGPALQNVFKFGAWLSLNQISQWKNKSKVFLQIKVMLLETQMEGCGVKFGELIDEVTSMQMNRFDWSHNFVI